jgi:hypothetical protein
MQISNFCHMRDQCSYDAITNLNLRMDSQVLYKKIG